MSLIVLIVLRVHLLFLLIILQSHAHIISVHHPQGFPGIDGQYYQNVFHSSAFYHIYDILLITQLICQASKCMVLYSFNHELQIFYIQISNLMLISRTKFTKSARALVQ